MGLTHGQVFVYTLMTVISILFLFITNAYLFRMNFEDWRSVPIPSLLWVNTGSLVLARVWPGQKVVQKKPTYKL